MRERRADILKFSVLGLMFSFSGIFLFELLKSNTFFEVLSFLYAHLSGFAISMFLPDIQVIGNSVFIGNKVLTIVPECSGFQALIIFLSIVWAYPGLKKMSKVAGSLMGILFFFSINVIRIVVAGLLIHRSFDLFSFFHYYLWQALFILMIAFVWFTWLKWAGKYEQTETYS